MNNVLKFVALGSALVFTGAAMAQNGMETRKQDSFTIRAGAFFPTDTGARNGSNGWFSFGVEYAFLQHVNPTTPLERDDVSVSLDYLGHNNFRSVPLLVNVVHHSGPVYFTGGVGVAFTRRPTTTGSEDKTEFGYQVGVGYEFSNSDFPIFIEGKFMGNGRSQLNGFVVSVGARF